MAKKNNNNNNSVGATTPKYTKIKDMPDFMRDNKSRAIINVNPDIYMASQLRKRKARMQREEIKSMKKDINDIKALLKDLINNLNGNA